MSWLMLLPFVVLFIVLCRRVPSREPHQSNVDDAPRPPIYKTQGLWKVYPGPAGPVAAVRNVDVELREGLTAIVGPSGGGKTSLLNMFGGLDEPSAGWIEYRGQAIPFHDTAAMQLFRSECVAWVFQELNLIGHQTAVENVALPLLCRGTQRKEALDVADELLERLGVAHRRGHYPEQLSRGERQRVAIARAFASNAGVILADEPTGSLDPKTADGVMQAFRDMAHREGKPVVLVTHNLELAGHCDRRLVCTREGVVEATAPAADEPLVPIGELNDHWATFGSLLDEDDDPQRNTIPPRDLAGGGPGRAPRRARFCDAAIIDNESDDGIYRTRKHLAGK
jgi:ABC-type lipoprotein export system ATPase subunit